MQCVSTQGQKFGPQLYYRTLLNLDGAWSEGTLQLRPSMTSLRCGGSCRATQQAEGSAGLPQHADVHIAVVIPRVPSSL